MKISLIVAAAANNVIGRAGGIPWRLPEDLKRFKTLTLGKPVIMGRRTFESIGRPLPGRTNIVLTRKLDRAFQGCVTAADSEAALALARDAEEVMVIGGGRVYQEWLPLAHRIYLTRLHARIEGDAFFPDFKRHEWRLVERRDLPASGAGQPAYSFLTLDRIEL